MLLLSQGTLRLLGWVLLGMVSSIVFRNSPCHVSHGQSISSGSIWSQFNVINKSTSTLKVCIPLPPNSLRLNISLLTRNSPLEFHWNAAMVRIPQRWNCSAVQKVGRAETERSGQWEDHHVAQNESAGRQPEWARMRWSVSKAWSINNDEGYKN